MGEHSAFREELIRVLIYPIQFNKNPINNIDGLLKMYCASAGVNASPRDYAAAINSALRSAATLSKLIP